MCWKDQLKKKINHNSIFNGTGTQFGDCCWLRCAASLLWHKNSVGHQETTSSIPTWGQSTVTIRVHVTTVSTKTCGRNTTLNRARDPVTDNSTVTCHPNPVSSRGPVPETNVSLKTCHPKWPSPSPLPRPTPNQIWANCGLKTPSPTKDTAGTHATASSSATSLVSTSSPSAHNQATINISGKHRTFRSFQWPNSQLNDELTCEFVNRLSLHHNGSPVVMSWSNPGDHQTRSNTAILWLKPNDRVYLKMEEGSYYESNQYNLDGHVSFSGFNIQ